MRRVFFFNDTATTEIYTLSLHDALPISTPPEKTTPGIRATAADWAGLQPGFVQPGGGVVQTRLPSARLRARSEEHTSELQSRHYLVCGLLLEKQTSPGYPARVAARARRV